MGAKLNTGGRGSYRPMAEINVTPFVDVMLVLLVVFMVAAPLLTSGVPIDLPNSEAKALTEEDNKPVEVHLDKDKKLYIGEDKDTSVKKERLIALLGEITKNNPDARIYIRADKSLDYGYVMSVLGAVNGAGFRKVALISEQTK